jgi:beta-glucosidase
VAAAKSMVLLRNQGMLPLQPAGIKKLAVIGEDAQLGRLGGYSGPGNGTVNILQGLQEALPGTSISFAAGYSRKNRAWETIPARYLSHELNGKKNNGLLGAYHNNMDLAGEPVFTRADGRVDFHWTLYSPDERLPRDFYAVRWTGLLTPDSSGVFNIGLDGNDGFRLFINDSLLVNAWEKKSYSTIMKPYSFKKGESYRIRVEFREPVGNARVRLIWDKGVRDPWQQMQQEAVQLARTSDAVVLVAGIHEGEFQDRALLNLDYHQEELIEAVAATGKPVTVLLVGGSAITMSRWLNKVNAVMMVWYPGEEGGHAVADVLLGKVNPAGRLPITFPVHEAQLPLSYWHLPTGRGDDYHNLSGEPLFPFGFGLSYTRFAYSNLQLENTVIRPGESATLRFTVTNTGPLEGDEVIQLYIRDEIATLARPVMELKGFQRISLKKGESRQVVFRITPDMLSMFNAEGKRVVEPGEFRIMVGASSKDIRLKTTINAAAR